MHWTRVSLFCLGAALLASSQPAVAQVVNEQTGVVQLDDYSGSMSLTSDGGNWVQVDRMSGNGVGFQSGFTRVGIRTKLAEFGESHFFSEVIGTINDQSRLGTNLGAGWRTMYDGGVLGVHGWYDNYESNYGNNYQQAVVGAEYLHEWLDLRANGYMPFGDRDNFIGVIDPGTELTFFGHDFGTIGTGQVERSLAGFDAEAGVPLPVATFLRIYGGTYFLSASDEDTWGVRSRLEARVGQTAALNFMVSDDNMFGTNLNFGATVWYGGGPNLPFKFNRNRSGYSRIYDPVRRNQPVQLVQDRERVNVPLTNAETGNRFNITWVDNTAAGGGDGTVENPFNTLPNTAPGSDYILVRRGVGNTTGNIVLENNQHMFGEGRVYTVDTVERGIVTIPDAFFDQTGPRPNLVAANPALPIVTLANNNEVINFNMTGGGVGIFGNVVQDFRIEHVAINASNGVFISDASGNGLLNNIDVTANGAGTGVFIRNAGGDDLNLTATDITSTSGSFGLQVLAAGANVFANIDGVTTDRTTDTGIVLDQNSGLLNANLTNIDVRNTANATNDGILIQSVNGQSNIDLSNVRVRGVGDLLSIVGTDDVLTVDLIDGDFSNSVAGSGIEIDVDNVVGGVFRFENIISSNNADDGYRLNAENGSVVLATVTDSDVSFNGDNNFDVSASGGSIVNFVVDPTSGTDAGNEAFTFVASDAGTILNSTFIDVDLARAGGTAISGLVQDGATSNLIVTNVQASDSGLHGLSVNVVDSATFNATIRNSTFTRSGLGNNGIGVNLFVSNNSDAFIDMDATPANNNGSQGLHYEVSTGADGASSLTGIVTNGNFSDNPVNNIFGQVTGAGSTANWNFTNVTADLLAANGAVQLSSLTGGQQTINWSGINSSISQSTGDGVNLTANGANSVLNFSFSDGRINSNGVQGIDALATNSGAVTVNLTDAEVTLNTEENVLAAATLGGTMTVNATNSDLSQGGLGTASDNVLLTANGAGSLVGGVFDGVNLDNSGQHGLHAFINNQGSLDLDFLSSDPLNPGSASNNANGSGIRINAANADEINVVSSGNSVISNNQNDNVDIDVAGANVANIQIAGQMNSSVTGDGINVNYDNVLSGGINIGTGTANDNFDDGVDIVVNNSNLDSGISVTGMTVTGNGDEPIVVVTSNSTITGGAISNNTVDGGNNGISWNSDSGTVDVNITGNTVTGSTDNGILVTLTGTAIGNDVHIDFNTVNGDGISPQNGIQLNLSNNAQLLTGTINGNAASDAANWGVLVNVGDNALVDSLTVDANIMSNNGIDGFLYTASGTTTLNNLVVSDNSADGNVGAGLNVLLDGVQGNGDVEFRGNLVSGNAGDGILMTGINTSLTNLDFLANSAATNGGNGITVDMSSGGAETLTSIFGQGNSATGNVGTGISVSVDGFSNAVPTDVIFETSTLTGNGAGGISLAVANMDADEVIVRTSAIGNNTGDGALITLDTANVAVAEVSSSSSDTNTGHGVNVVIDASTLDQLNILENNASNAGGTGLSTNGGDGVHITADNAAVLNALAIDNNLITGNTSDGIELEVLGGSTLPAIGNGLVSNNEITGHTAGDGFRLVNPDTAGGNFSIDFEGNTITGNSGGEGVNITLDGNAGVFTTEFVNNDISTNGNNGILLSTTDTSGIDVTDFSGNNVSTNGDMGVRIQALLTSSIDFAGGVSAAANGTNTLDGNTNAGIGGLYQDNATGNFSISDTEITNTVAGGDANFDGSGIRFVTDDDARISNFVIGGAAATPGVTNMLLSGNAGSGVSLELGQLSGIYDSGAGQGPEIRNADINTNGVDGITFTRFGSAKIDDIVIENNSITDNTNNGINFAMQGGNVDIDQPLPNTALVINALIQDNIIDGSVNGSAILHDLDADVHMNTTITGNELTNSNLDGITVTGQFDSILNGTWSDNLITNNGRDGINITLTERATAGSVIGDLIIETSQISNNTRDGIRVVTTNSINPTSAPNANVVIRDNGPTFPGDPTGIQNNGGSGINLISQSISNIAAQIDDNAIYQNGLDGITSTSEDASTMAISATGNDIFENGRHGVNLTNSELALMNTTLTDNIIQRNIRRGVSILNEGQFAGSTVTINGTVDPRPSAGTLATSLISQNGEVGVYVENNAGTLNSFNTIDLTLANTAIVGNGTNTAVAADQRNGVYIRVGTSGGFVGTEVGGFVNATVDQNFMSGNGNVDFVTDSFVATPDPSVASQYTSAGYRFDPLARLGLVLSNNQGDSIDVVRTGAFYTNNDAFKSPNALFDNATRRRNAQRFSNDLLISVQNVSGSTAPAAGAVAGTVGPGGAGLPNNTFNDLGIDIAGNGIIGGANRDVTAYALATNVITFTPALGAAPAVGTPFDLEAIDISGLGLSTFRTDQVSVAAGGNVFTNVITDFGTQFTLDPTNPGAPDVQPILGNPQTFTWQTLGLPFY